MGEAPVVGLQLVPFGGRKRELGELLHLPLELLAFGGQRERVLLPLQALALEVLPAAPRALHIASQRARPGECIQQIALRGRSHQ